ncbi:hypothetical protein SCT_2837 [Sulfuricella sp. T08]|uniref:hypothetical protein n=1 Tax=Sulfuricella sp. T08 TaxID=1632857 RepID=UPI0006179A98|nr:hypothetical protein [Sulfuricella sp. T08]GAO37415.1 hypothetical protein SCT_2837 [Sulfuricella sp. T08]
MNILKELENRLKKDSNDPAGKIFHRLVGALCCDGEFKLTEIYELNYDDFELSLEIIKHWRLDRYTKTKERLQKLVSVSTN